MRPDPSRSFALGSLTGTCQLVMRMNNTFRQRYLRPVNGSLARRRGGPVAKIAVGRSLNEFLPLLPGEKRLLHACRQGDVAKLGTLVPDVPQDELRVRAAFLRFLLLGGDELAPIHERGVRLAGAVIEGRLDLGGCRIPRNITLKQCRFTDQFFAQDARVQGLLTLEGSFLPKGIRADRIQCEGGMFLRNGFKATGTVRLLGAQIGGSLSCRGGQFEVEEGSALSADRLVVEGSLFLGVGFTATGEVRLLGAQVGGNLDCSGGQIEVKEGKAFSADRSVVKGDVFLSDGFKAIGEVRLLGAQIGGNLDCGSGQFEVKEAEALSADGAVVKGDVLLLSGFKAIGEVRLLGAQISGNLNCSGGQFEVKEGVALSADGAVVKGDVFFNNGFKAIGTVRLLGAQMGGDLDCSGGQFEVNEGIALAADRSVVKGDLYLTHGFNATGEVRLLGAQIGGDLNCSGGQFDAKKDDALNLQSVVVRGGWVFRGLNRPVSVNASHMQVEVLVDEINSWGEGVVLDGLRYGTLGGGAPTQAKARLLWLCKQLSEHLGETEKGRTFRPQPWRQLQRVLREMGHVEDARQIGIAFEQQLRKADLIGRTAPNTWKPLADIKRTFAHAGHALFGWLSGYGYRPMRLVFGMAAVWLICGISYWYLALPPHHAIGPSDPLVFQNERYAACVPESQAADLAAASGVTNAGNWFLCDPLPAEYSTFSPLAFSLDILLPLVDLGQERAWGPLVPTPQQIAWEEGLALSPGHLVRILVWFETLFGWVGSLLLVGIVSGFARRSEE